jgi:serine/threonine-protein kinase
MASDQHDKPGSGAGQVPTIGVSPESQEGPALPAGQDTHGLDLSASTPPVEAARGLPVLPHYEIVELLGQGGMGRVFKARDLRLRRTVALKLIRGDDPELVRRFLNEAQAQARIEHPNVCKVYEVGEVAGQPWIAMQLVAGRSLAEERTRLTREEKAVVVATVAEAVHAAHRLGIVHRDLKPANVMLERGEDGRVVPYVLDFGLAQDIEGESTSKTGLVVGTPAYMAPEQARGDRQRIDRRTDVYSLGATLYALLTGSPPFEAAGTFDLLEKVIHQEPVPPRRLDSSIPADLETIVLKCLEKDPGRRYDSARALAEDLRRYLAGEPIAARPASLAERAWKRARKHKALVATAAIALVAVGVQTVLVLEARRTAALRERVAQQFGQDAERADWILRTAYQLPLHEPRRERAMARAIQSDLERRMRELGDVAAGPGHYALGRGHLALREHAQARQHLEQAWSLGERAPEVAYALGTALGALYLAELRAAERMEPALREQRRKQAVEGLREPALRYLRTGANASGVAPDYAEALVAGYEGQWDRAETLAARAVEKLPWLHEAIVLRGDAALGRGRTARERGDYGAALESIALAAARYREAAAIGRSDPAVYQRECAAWGEAMYVRNDQQQDPSEPYRKALVACGDAITADPASAEAHDNLAYAHWQWGQHLLAFGSDPRQPLQLAVLASGQAQKLRPEWATPYNTMGIAYGYLGRAAAHRGEDPLPLIDKAIESFRAALARDPNFAYAHATMGIGYLEKARQAAGAGGDPTDWLRQSIESEQRALALNPDWKMPLAFLGAAHLARARHDAAQGRDAAEDFRAAIEVLVRLSAPAARSGPAAADQLLEIAQAYQALARNDAAQGRDPRPSLEAVLRPVEAALVAKPGLAEAVKLRREVQAALDVDHPARSRKSPNKEAAR